MALYRRIRELREDYDKKQSEVAQHLQTTAQYYGKYESGEREIPFSRAIMLADYYGVSLDYLANRTNSRSNDQCDFTDDERKIAFLYSSLSERNKGKVELFIDQLIRRQSK